MLDFMDVVPEEKNRTLRIRPKFYARRTTDLMIRGGEFYAIWDEESKLWSTDPYRAIEIIDQEIHKGYEDYISKWGDNRGAYPAYLNDYSSKMLDEWNRFCKAIGDLFTPLDEKIIFANQETCKEDYVTKRLPYSLEEGSHNAWDEMLHTLYSEDEAAKIEWLIGCIATGDSKKLQKFFVFYGSGGTGKSTILHVIEDLFEGFWVAFEAKNLGSASDAFALEPFSTYPLIAINHDGNLSKIENNARINSLVSHESMVINEKHKHTYSATFHTILLMGTNKPVQITDAKSGLIRRVIDIVPSGNLLPRDKYDILNTQIRFELGAICKHCIDVYKKAPNKYNKYIPERMIASTNYMYDFVSEYFNELSKPEGIALNAAYQLYTMYKDNAMLAYPLNKLNFKEELKNYYKTFTTRASDGRYNVFSDFIFDKFRTLNTKEPEKTSWINLQEQPSILDELYSDFKAQYTKKDGTPKAKWENVKTTLKDLNTHELHYVLSPPNYIFMDFDLKDENGNKSLEKNIEAASKFPPTYAEVSKGGQGLHLHYIYTGDPFELDPLYSEGIEIKVFKGNSALRRKLTLCNDLPITTISSGLPLKLYSKKGGKDLLNANQIQNESHLRALIAGNLMKRYLPSTKSSMDMIKKVTDEAYESGVPYDVTDMAADIYQFAADSTHQAKYCLALFSKLHLQSEYEYDESPEDITDNWNNAPIMFFDCEVFPNLLVICYKKLGGDSILKMINPTPEQVRSLFKYRLVGFNNRRYDNHILFARSEGYSIEAVYNVSRKIVNKEHGAFFGSAYNISYTDIYDFASAQNKKSLKKFEIELGIHHQELGYDWNKPVDKERWVIVANYCANDVLATEAVWNYLQGDFAARKILAKLAGGAVNETTNALTQKIIFRNDKNPQDQFYYRNLAEPVNNIPTDVMEFIMEFYPATKDYKTSKQFPFDREGVHSFLPFFPGYKYEGGKSTYKGNEIGEGGLVWAKPGIYYDVEVNDVTSMHPSSIIDECLFGPVYTRNFTDLKFSRVCIKHQDWDTLRKMLDGKFNEFVDQIISGDINPEDLSAALKTAINSVYGLTAASFDNKFRDPRNIDNIVAKRGALFMVDLKNAVLDRGYHAFHIKTDSIKIAIDSSDNEIREFVKDFGWRYGYEFEIEYTFEKICLVNNAVYIAKDYDGEWHATGAQFAVPYVFKKLFSKEPIGSNDLAQIFNVAKGELYLDFNEDLPEGEHDLKFVGKTGLFYPIKPGCGGAELRRKLNDNDKLYYPSGSTGYRFLEKEAVDASMQRLEDIIDYNFWEKMVQDAIETISKFGDFDKFVQ